MLMENTTGKRLHSFDKKPPIGPFHLMSAPPPPLLRVNYKFYPLGKKRSKCRRIPPFRKRQMFSRDQRYRHSYPLRNYFKNPLPLPRISLILNRGGVRTLNGMAHFLSILCKSGSKQLKKKESMTS